MYLDGNVCVGVQSVADVVVQFGKRLADSHGRPHSLIMYSWMPCLFQFFAPVWLAEQAQSSLAPVRRPSWLLATVEGPIAKDTYPDSARLGLDGSQQNYFAIAGFGRWPSRSGFEAASALGRNEEGDHSSDVHLHNWCDYGYCTVLVALLDWISLGNWSLLPAMYRARGRLRRLENGLEHFTGTLEASFS